MKDEPRVIFDHGAAGLVIRPALDRQQVLVQLVGIQLPEGVRAIPDLDPQLDRLPAGLLLDRRGQRLPLLEDVAVPTRRSLF